jgi:hypothetical protein
MSTSGAFERFTELLEFEIDRIHTEESRPGWTIWALLGSLATVLWFIVAELEKNTIDSFNALFLLLALSLICDCLKEIPLILSGPSTLSSPLRLRFTRSIFQGRIYSLAALGRSIALIVVTTMIRPFVGAWYIVAAYVFYGRLALAFAGRFILGFLRIPSPLRGETPYRDVRWIVLQILLLAPGILALFGLSSVLSNQTISPAVFEYRFSGLLAAATLILLMIAQDQSRTPLLATLMHIRRSLIFGNTDLASAKQQAEIALMGMTIADAFQDDLRRLLSDLEQANTLLEAIEEGLQGILSMIDKNNSEISKEQRVLVEAVRRSSQIDLDNAEKTLTRFNKRCESFRRRTRLFLGKRTELTEERDDLIDRLIAMRKAVEERIDRSKEILRTLARLLNSADKEQEVS